MYLAAVAGNGCGPAASSITGALATEAQLNVAREVGLARSSGVTTHTEGGGGHVLGAHQLHLAEGTARGNDRTAHVLQDGATSRGQRGGKGVPARDAHVGQGGPGPGGRGEAATRDTGVTGSLSSARVDGATQITNIDEVASVSTVLTETREAHVLYLSLRNNLGGIRNFGELLE